MPQELEGGKHIIFTLVQLMFKRMEDVGVYYVPMAEEFAFTL
jgi:hypothetical protein